MTCKSEISFKCAKNALSLIVLIVFSLWVLWFLHVRPHTYDWRPAGEAIGEVTIVKLNSSKARRSEVTTYVKLESGETIHVKVPVVQNIRAGRKIRVLVNEDADNPKRKRYIYISPLEQN